MKRMPLYLGSLVLMVALFSSCKPSRVWATKDKKKDKYEKEQRYEDERYDRNDRYDPPPPPPPPPPAPRYYANAALVISPTPGFIMNKSSDARYYHRNQQGFLYWKAYDDRFYLDRSYLNRVRYTQWEYEQWRRLSRS